jgi:hypothetical protein
MRAVADSIIIGYFALRVLQGQLLRRITESVYIGLFSLSMLAGWVGNSKHENG